jgi:hypothetical protein
MVQYLSQLMLKENAENSRQTGVIYARFLGNLLHGTG